MTACPFQNKSWLEFSFPEIFYSFANKGTKHIALDHV